VENRLEFFECKRLGSGSCEMILIQEIRGLEGVLKEIVFVFGVATLVVIFIGYYLALLSLRPMRESIETIDSFINGIVHDINTPLSVIKLNAQSMQTKLQEEYLVDKNARILQGIADIESLEEQLLFSLKADRYELKLSEFNLSDLLQERLKIWSDIRPSVKIVLHLKTLHIKADKPILTRMIDNIVLNAIKFSSRNSEVIVELLDTKLIVSDSGIGIKNPQKVFSKYYREQSTTKGLGLGLFIVNSVASLHGIDINIKSKVNVGTQFTLELKNIKVT